MRKKITDETRQKLIRYERKARMHTALLNSLWLYIFSLAVMFVAATGFFSDFSLVNIGMSFLLSTMVVCFFLLCRLLSLPLNCLMYKTYDPDKTEFFGKGREFTREYCEYRRRCDIYAAGSEVYTEVFTCIGKHIGFLELVLELQSGSGQKRKRGVSAAAYLQIRKQDRVVMVTGKQPYHVYGVYPGKFVE